MFQSSSTPLMCVPGAHQVRPVDKQQLDISRQTVVSMVKIPCATAQFMVGLKGFGKRRDYIWSERRWWRYFCYVFFSFLSSCG